MARIVINYIRQNTHKMVQLYQLISLFTHKTSFFGGGNTYVYKFGLLAQ